MFSRLFGFIFILFILYLMLVFVAPNIADQYGNTSFNANIRTIKDQSLQFASGSDSPSSLFDKIKNTSSQYVEDTKKTIQGVQSTVNTKVNQVHEASMAVEKAYTGVMDAANKIQNLTGTGK